MKNSKLIVSSDSRRYEGIKKKLCKYHSVFLTFSMMVQQIPELMGFLISLGKYPIKKLLQPFALHISIKTLLIEGVPFAKAILLLRTSKGWLIVMAMTPAKNAGIKVVSMPSSFIKMSSLSNR